MPTLLQYSHFRLGKKLEKEINKSIRQISYNAWWEDHITYTWLSAVVPILKKTKLSGATEKRSIDCSLFKLRGRVEQHHGDVAVLVTQYFHDGLSVTGVGLLEAKACDRDTDGFSSLNSAQLERLYKKAHYPKFLLYDRERIVSDCVELTHPDVLSDDFPRPHTTHSTAITHAAVVPMHVMKSRNWRNRRAYRFAVPLSYQLTYRYLLGLDLDTDAAIVNSVLSAKKREHASTYVLSISIAAPPSGDSPTTPPPPLDDLYTRFDEQPD